MFNKTLYIIPEGRGNHLSCATRFEQKYIPYAIVYTSAYTLKNNIILPVEKWGGEKIGWRTWGGIRFEHHRSIQGGQMQDSSCQVQEVRYFVLPGIKPISYFQVDAKPLQAHALCYQHQQKSELHENQHCPVGWSHRLWQQNGQGGAKAAQVGDVRQTHPSQSLPGV